MSETRITFFVVGAGADQAENETCRGARRRGHEIGNHSYRHEPWLHLYEPDELDEELAKAETALERVTGVRPVGFRGPGYSLSEDTLRVLADRGYQYDASTLPTVIGPLARAFYFRTAKLDAEQRRERAGLFGQFSDGLRPLRPYRWSIGDATLTELPVTTMPLTHPDPRQLPDLPRPRHRRSPAVLPLRTRAVSASRGRGLDPPASARLHRTGRPRCTGFLPGHGHGHRPEAGVATDASTSSLGSFESCR